MIPEPSQPPVYMPPDEYGQYVLDPRDVNPNYIARRTRHLSFISNALTVLTAITAIIIATIFAQVIMGQF